MSNQFSEVGFHPLEEGRVPIRTREKKKNALTFQVVVLSANVQDSYRKSLSING